MRDEIQLESIQKSSKKRLNKEAIARLKIQEFYSDSQRWYFLYLTTDRITIEVVYGKWVNFLSITKGKTVFVRAGLKPVHFVSSDKVELELDEQIERITGIISGDSVRRDFRRIIHSYIGYN